MPLIDIAERAGVGADDVPRPSEDHVVLLPHAVALLDGATEARADALSGGWYARRLAERIEQALTETPTRHLARLLADSIESVATRHQLVPRRAPSSTVTVLRWDSETVEALVLADSPVVAFTASGPEVVADTRLAELRRAGRLRTRADVERLRNTDGGFWVAEADPGAAWHALHRRWRRADLDAVVLATDGASVGVDQYGVLDWPAALALARWRGAAAVLDVVRTAEHGDPMRSRWPRSKRHDDQALALIDFRGDR